MTVDTPFPQRPPTPFWSPRGPEGLGSLGDDTTDITTAALSDATAAFIATQQAACPTGYVFNPAVNGCQLVATTTTSSGSPGMLLLLAVGAYLLFARGGR